MNDNERVANTQLCDASKFLATFLLLQSVIGLWNVFTLPISQGWGFSFGFILLYSFVALSQTTDICNPKSTSSPVVLVVLSCFLQVLLLFNYCRSQIKDCAKKVNQEVDTNGDTTVTQQNNEISGIV